MIEHEHHECTLADIEEAQFLERARQILLDLRKEEQMHKKIHAAAQLDKLQSHQVHELKFIQGRGYEPVPIPQHERQ